MNREELEDELREQLHTVLHVTSAMQPKSDEEFIAVALPNLMLWAFDFIAAQRQAAAEEEREAILEIIDDGYKSPIKGNIDGETCIGRSRLVEHIRSRQPNQSQ